MKTTARCPACGHSPTDGRHRYDGDIGICRACGTQEVSPGVDIEAQWVALAALDARWAACWFEVLVRGAGSRRYAGGSAGHARA